MKVLCIFPPMVPSYFNAGHHLGMFQVATYLRRLGHDVVARDFAALNATWRDVCRLLVEDFDVIAVMNEFDGIDGLPRFLDYCRELAPQARVITFGRASRQCPGFFEQFDLDAIAASGDHESAIASYLDYLEGHGQPRGIRLRGANGFFEGDQGTWLPAEDWAFPSISDIPYAHYEAMYGNDLDRFCGVPARRELVVPVARGCPVGCGFCDVPTQQGLKERRARVSDTLDYIERCFAERPFDYVSFYAPTFTLKRRWVEEFCDEVRKRPMEVNWKCVTTLQHLNPTLITEMGRAGCFRISVGIETFSALDQSVLPHIKQSGNRTTDLIADACDAAEIELNCFVILGLPGDDLHEMFSAISRLTAAGHRVRPTVFTDYSAIKADMSISDFRAFNRQLFRDETLDASEKSAAYDILYSDRLARETEVQDKIPSRRARSDFHGYAEE